MKPLRLWSLIAAMLGILLASSPALAASPPPTRALPSRLVSPAALVLLLKSPHPPTVVMVGFKELFRQGHVPGARFFGEGSSSEGLAAFARGLAKLPGDRDVVLYCGCCPWEDCPNLQPAYALAHRRCGERAKMLVIPRDFERDWVAKGFPLAR